MNPEKRRQMEILLDTGYEIVGRAGQLPAVTLQAIHETLPDGSGYYRIQGHDPCDEAGFDQLLDQLGYRSTNRRLEVEVYCIKRQYDEQGNEIGGAIARRRGGAGGAPRGEPAIVLYTLMPFDADAVDVLSDQSMREHRGNPNKIIRLRHYREASKAEIAGVRRLHGSDAKIVLCRDANHGEDLLGIQSILRIVKASGETFTVGFGIYGEEPFSFRAPFAMLGEAATLTPEQRSAVEAAAKAGGMTLHLPREQKGCGIGVLASDQKGDLFLLWVTEAGAVEAEPYTPGLLAGANEEQLYWVNMRSERNDIELLDGWLRPDGTLEVLFIDHTGTRWRVGLNDDGLEDYRFPLTENDFPA